VVRLVEVHEHVLALSPGDPQDLAETAPVEEGVVAAVLLLECAEEVELLRDKRRSRRRRCKWRRLGRLLLVNMDAPWAAPRSTARYRPRQPLDDAGREPRHGPSEAAAGVP
jgi:CelD/BcsL family acetyltransferase involved in cellulose biosynthesis